MKIRALVWDRTANLGDQSRRGPLREHTNSHQALRDLEHLKQNCDEAIESKIIDERDKHWNGPVDTIFSVKPDP